MLGLTQPSPHQLGTLRRLFLTSSVHLSDHEASVSRSSQVRGCQACTRETRVSAVCTPIYGPEGSSGNLPPAVSYPWTMVPWQQSTSPTPLRASSQSSAVHPSLLSVQQSGLARREGDTDD